MEEESLDYGPLMLLPNELIGLILQKANCRDIVNFGATCKRYNEFVNTNQYIWREKFKEILPQNISRIVEKHANGNWLDEIKRFYAVKARVYEELIAMSPRYYWRTSELTLEDVKNFFDVALSYNIHFYYVVFILQDVIRQGILYADRNTNERPFSMTDVYYAKIVVRFLTQSFLTVKWVQCHIRNELTPDAVVNYFVQWVDPVTMHSDDKVRAAIKSLVLRVEEMFHDDANKSKQCHNIREKLAKGLVGQKQVLEAVSDVIYNQLCLSIISGANLEGLDIVKAIETRRCSLVVAAVIYQAVARYCGVHCELIAFPNHLFLEWRHPMEPGNTCKIDLETGELAPQGRCPFAPSGFRKEYKYSPDGFLQYIVSGFLMTMGAVKNWYTQNALFLLDFLSNNISDDNPYRDFLPYLDAILDFNTMPELNRPIDMDFVHDGHIQIINTLTNLNPAPTQFCREVEEKHHEPSVSFAVGMQAYHKKYDYVGVVRGWDARCTTDWRRRVEFKSLELGPQQPFYSLIASDQSERYVAQENLIHVDKPKRQFYIEEVIAKEFSHFDGFCYVPNAEKEAEYPDDGIIRRVHRTRAELRAKELRDAL